MKKILALILVLACSFALFACGEDAAPSYAEQAAEFITAFGATEITALNVTVTTEIADGTLTATYNTAYNADKTGTMTYSIETIPGLDSAEDLEVLTGTITCDANGTWSDGGAISGKLGASGIKFDYDSSKISNFTVDGNVLAITVAAADTEAVIGCALGTDALVTVTKAEGKIVSVALSYTGVSIVCVYN
jgi:hypothetical protein